MTRRYYWELMWDDRGSEWAASGNAGIAWRKKFATITETVQAGLKAGVLCGLVYRIKSGPNTPLLVLDGRQTPATLSTWADWAEANGQ